VIQKMMAKARDDRYRDCQELLDDLDEAEDKSSVAVRGRMAPHRGGERRGARQHEPAGTRPHGPVERREAPPDRKRNMHVAIGAAALGAVLLVVGLLVSGRTGRSEARDRRPEGTSTDATQKTGTARPVVPVKPEVKAQPAAAATKPEAKSQSEAQPGKLEAEDRRPEGGVERPWRAVFDGKTLECLVNKGNGAWRVENGALVNVPGKDDAALTSQEFGDGHVRIRFEVKGGDFAFFKVRESSITWTPTPRLASLAGKQHELVFQCVRNEVTASLDGQPVALVRAGGAPKGRLQFNLVGGTLRVLSIEYRELPLAQPETGNQKPETAGAAA
jgi:hypothetical protein